jgi:hypothetical protein
MIMMIMVLMMIVWVFASRCHVGTISSAACRS